MIAQLKGEGKTIKRVHHKKDAIKAVEQAPHSVMLLAARRRRKRQTGGLPHLTMSALLQYRNRITRD
jgi:hypothetical protein